MSRARQEYSRFLAWLARETGESDADARRVAKIVIDHFDEISATSHYQGRRAALVARLMRAEIAEAPHEIEQTLGAPPNPVAPWSRLHHLTVGPFRGFREPEQFDISRRVVLFYGPNGSGKTSLCEALEFALLGNVQEAEARRIDAGYYLTNIHEGYFAPPELIATTEAGGNVQVAHDSDRYRFCFIEKNRIDAFSRLAARTQSERSELIAALFGIDAFSDFVNEFNETIDGQLTTIPLKRMQLESRQLANAADIQLVQLHPESLRALDLDDTDLAREVYADTTYGQLVELLGTEESPGRLQELNAKLLRGLPSIIGLSVSTLREALELAEDAYEAKRALEQQLLLRARDVSLKGLYETLLQLEPSSPEHCPACETPLIGDRAVVVNPFVRARAGLGELHDLSALQSRLNDATATSEQRSLALRDLIDVACKYATDHSLAVAQALSSFLAQFDPASRWWRALLAPSSDEHSVGWNDLASVVTQIETDDVAARALANQREAAVLERDRLDSFVPRVARHKERRVQAIERFNAAVARLATSDAQNAQLIEDANAEDAQIDFSARSKAAYDTFLAYLRRYRNELPRELLADMNDAVRVLYNSFNHNDHESDKLAAVTLPLDHSDRIEVAFNRNPEVFHDALHVLSEGHIRCLGLAMLLAKNVALNCPLVLFDDAVNAIDHDHRAGIRGTLFTNPIFANKQILVTCHGEEFIKDIEVMLGADVARNDCVSYTFLPHHGDNRINVHAANSRNYVVEAQRLIAQGEIRRALAEGRRAMESLNGQTWKFLDSLGLGELRVKMIRPRSPLESHDVALALKARIDSPEFVHPKKHDLSAAYTAVLAQRHWACLNAGTHEREDVDDFDLETVRIVIENLATLDRVLTRR